MNFAMNLATVCNYFIPTYYAELQNPKNLIAISDIHCTSWFRDYRYFWISPLAFWVNYFLNSSHGTKLPLYQLTDTFMFHVKNDTKMSKHQQGTVLLELTRTKSMFRGEWVGLSYVHCNKSEIAIFWSSL